MSLPESLYSQPENGKAAIESLRLTFSDQDPNLPLRTQVDEHLIQLAAKSNDPETRKRLYLKRWHCLYDEAVAEVTEVADLLGTYLNHHNADLPTQRRVVTNSSHIGRFFGAVRPIDGLEVKTKMRKTPETAFSHTPEFTTLTVNDPFRSDLIRARDRKIGCPILALSIGTAAQKRNLYDLAWDSISLEYAENQLTGQRQRQLFMHNDEL